MKESYKTAKEILERYLNGQCSEEEARLVEKWYNQSGDPVENFDTELAQKHLSELWRDLNASTKKPKIIGFKKITYAAACLVILLGLGIYLDTKQNANQTNLPHESAWLAEPVDQAILTLADGSIIKLDSLQVGQRLSQQGVIITKQQDGTVIYQADSSYSPKTQGTFNTITTPRGKQYSILLPDDSRVWLNAASRIRFPVAFSEDRRGVELSGEGFFEVESDPTRPFVVSSKNQQTTVKGTKFNINAYPEDSKMTTTLLEGAVLVSISEQDNNNLKQILLHPNEQIVADGLTFEKKRVDASHFASWKDGKFIYDNSPLETVMLQLARWYDVQIDYVDDIKGISFTGSLSKSDDIIDVLRKISLTESVHFEIKGRRVMVTR